jgi:DNA segregation ATPase FtsK/SpoIIIE, S-DNA-T family
MFKITLPKLPSAIPKLQLDLQSKYTLGVLALLAAGIQFYFSLINWAGNFGGIVGSFLRVVLGRGAFFVPALCFVGAILLIRIQRHDYKPPKNDDYPRMFWGITIMIWAVCGYFNLFNWVEYGTPSKSEMGGGFFGYLAYPLLAGFFGSFGGFVMLFFVWVYGFFLFSLMQPYDFIDKLKRMFTKEPELFWDFVPDIFEFWRKQTKKPEKEKDKDDEPNKEDLRVTIFNNLAKDTPVAVYTPVAGFTTEPVVVEESEFGNQDQPLEDQEDLFEEVLGKVPVVSVEEHNWKAPSLKLLQDTIQNNEQTKEAKDSEIEKVKETIKTTLKDFNIEVEMKDHVVGPTVTQYSFKPTSGVKLSAIEGLQSNLALELASTIRLETPIPGKSLVGLELPNKHKTVVRLKNLIDCDDFKPNLKAKAGDLPIIIGQSVSGVNLFYSLAKMPHLLVAGSTGSGKSVWINNLLLSLLYKYSPFQLELILVDMKRVELKLYDGIPHLLAPVITDAEKAINALKWAVLEMEKRYKILEQYGKRNIIDFNSFASAISADNKYAEENLKPLKYTVLVIDELGDLMMLAKNEVEPIIVRLTQMSRAVGIHLVLGTQRPDTQVVTGLIKANIPSRIGFAVATGIDSRVILDQVGAEKLLGQGDGLFMSPSTMKAVRFQGAYVDEDEVKKCVDSIKETAEKFKTKYKIDPSNNTPEIIEPPRSKLIVPGMRSSDESDLEGLVDDMYERVKEYAFTKGYVSTSALQTALGIGYPRARKFIQMMEEEGLVGPSNGSKPREVFMPEDWEG